MEPSKEAITLRISRLNRQILGKVSGGTYCKINKRTIDREALLDALTVLYDDCNEDPVKKSDELVRAFLDKYRSTLAELRRTRVCLSDFDMVQVIGRGHFGEVNMVREKQTGDVYALKILRKEQARKRAAGAAEDERDVLANAAGPWVPKLQYAFQDSSSLYLVMELCPGGDLAGLLARRAHPLSERDAAFYVAEVTHALKALHGLGYVHRDVKPHNILLDRCGHVKLGDFGSCARLSEGEATAAPVGTADYVAPELLAAAACAARHTVCLDCCRGITVHTAISACDYWSLGVVAFELVTLRRPFSTGDEDSIAQILSNIQKYERDPDAEPPFDASPAGPGAAWRALVAGLLRVQPSRRYNYLDTLQHPALAHLSLHTIRDQAPPWVPCVRGAEDASHFAPPLRAPAPPSAAPFRARPPFAGQLPFIGYSYVANDETEDITGGFNASHNSTAIEIATFKSAEKLAASRLAEIECLQSKLCAAEAASGAGVERARRAAADDHERLRARLQADITALALQNKRLERQVEVEKEERMAVERANQELAMGASERAAASAEIRRAGAERDAARDALAALQRRLDDVEAECKRAQLDAEAARAQHKHYKNILEQVKQLRHRRLTEINVKPLDTIARERALRRETLSGGEAAAREAAAAAAAAAAGASEERAARARLERQLQHADNQAALLRTDLDHVKKELAAAQELLQEKNRGNETVSVQLKEIQVQLTQERAKTSTLTAQVQELNRELDEARSRESAVEEQCARTETRLKERLEAAETKAASALHDDARHREKVNTLEQLVRQLEREVSALETRRCGECEARGGGGASAGGAHSDTESVDEPLAHAQLTVLKEQLERAEAQMQARTEEMAVLRQEARAANLARWRKEREFNELSVDAKSSAREVKRLEERLATVQGARKTNELKVASLQKELDALKPLYEQARAEADEGKQQLEKLLKAHETSQAEVDRSRNDIRKLKSEVQYSEKRRLHAEQQEELSSRERAQLRDELVELRASNNALVQNNKALQEACSLLEEQLTDLEKLSDINEVKNNDLESEVSRMRGEVSALRARLGAAERAAGERGAAAAGADQRCDAALEQARHAHCQLQLLKERLEVREARVLELEERLSVSEQSAGAAAGAAGAAARRVRDLLEECAALRTQAHHHQARADHLQRQLHDTQEEVSEAREAAEAAAAWWRTRETKADATLRQQAKLIDFLQAKVEEAGRKKCSLSHKLFGRSGRRTVASPPLRRANRELREEIEQLRARLASLKSDEMGYPPTPRKEKKQVNAVRSIDMPDSAQDTQDSTLQIVWSDGSRERMTAREVNGALELRGVGASEREGEGSALRATLLTSHANFLPHNEVGRAFTVQVENSSKGREAGAVCGSAAARASLVSRLRARPYWPAALCARAHPPAVALALEHDAIAIGCPDGLYSLRGKIELEWSEGVRESREVGGSGVRGVCSAGGRALVCAGGALGYTPLSALRSALRRAPSLRPALPLTPLALPGDNHPHLIVALRGEAGEGGICAAVGGGRRVFVVRGEGGALRVARSLTVDRAPPALLLLPRALYIAGERPLRVLLPAGALEPFAITEPTVAAAAAKHSPPRAILLVKQEPLEILLCYTECGVFVNENGKRTRNEDPKWSNTVDSWEFVDPFLYLVGNDRVTIVYLTEDAYRAPPCTCDSSSVASSVSECYMPEIYDLKMKEPALLGVTATGIIIRSKVNGEYSVAVVEGLAAFRSIGASVESLATSDPKGSSTDLVQSTTDLSNHDESQESVEVTTDFLADIRKRAKQLRDKNIKEMTSDEVIKEILTTEVGLKRPSIVSGRRSPATVSEFDSDTESEERVEVTTTADVCAEMFTRQKLLTG